jgi:hypothetical protein
VRVPVRAAADALDVATVRTSGRNQPSSVINLTLDFRFRDGREL